MDIKQRIESRIENLKLRIAIMEGRREWEQRQGELQDAIYILEDILQDKPPVEQEVSVNLTLSVDINISKEDIKSRILAHFGQSDGITTMAIEIKEEAEIYGNE